MILGLGSDIVNIARIEKTIHKFSKKFLQRIFTHNEITQAESIKLPAQKIAFYAKRWAAKEAFAKALGTGIRHGLNFNDIEIINDKLGKPYIQLNKELNLPKNSKIDLSLSDDFPCAFAIVIISCGNTYE